MDKIFVVFVFLLTLFSESYQRPTVPEQQPVESADADAHDLFNGVLLCQSPLEDNQEYMRCWHLRPDQDYRLYHRGDHGRTNLSPEQSTFTLVNQDLLARFNIHLYLDHMWHLNIGFTK